MTTLACQSRCHRLVTYFSAPRMPSIEHNQFLWNQHYDWSQAGEEWSAGWGDSKTQWEGSLLPRIKSFVPTGTILEIAPGFGRWTQFLKDLCDNLLVVDLSAKCLDACRARFATDTHIRYHLNDGKSLAMIPDASVDFVFSFDSLVHAEAEVLEAYVQQLARKLKPQGVGFIHHSNLGAYPAGRYTSEKCCRAANAGLNASACWKAMQCARRV
ncbi:MAG: class I SAM-dependent methyltransferase [Blastocatellia bacterium]